MQIGHLNKKSPIPLGTKLNVVPPRFKANSGLLKSLGNGNEPNGATSFTPLLRDDQHSRSGANLAPPIGSLNLTITIAILLNVLLKRL